MIMALHLNRGKQSIFNLIRSFKIRKNDKPNVSLDTTEYLMSSPANKARLEEAIWDIEAKKKNIITRDLSELWSLRGILMRGRITLNRSELTGTLQKESMNLSESVYGHPKKGRVNLNCYALIFRVTGQDGLPKSTVWFTKSNRTVSPLFSVNIITRNDYREYADLH